MNRFAQFILVNLFKNQKPRPRSRQKVMMQGRGFFITRGTTLVFPRQARDSLQL